MHVPPAEARMLTPGLPVHSAKAAPENEDERREGRQCERTARARAPAWP